MSQGENKGLPRGVRLFLTLIGFVLICFVVLFVYKKIYFDYTGEYAKETVVYSPDYSFAKTIDFFDKYKKNDIEGFAIVNIPLSSLFSDKRIKVHNSTSNFSDSEEMLNNYQLKNIALNVKNGSYSDYLGEEVSTLGSMLMAFAPENVTATCNINGKDYYIIEYSDLLIE